MRRLDYVDALRGYAILGVLIVHVGQATDFMGPTWWGARGVQLFFVVSAMTLFASWRERGDGAFAFYVRRFFRIAPMFWLAVAFYFFLPYRGAHGDGAVEWSLWQTLSTAFFINGTAPQTLIGTVPGGWSVADEMLFYAIFPLIAITITTWRRAALFFACAFALSLAVASQRGHAALGFLFPTASRDELSLFAYLGLPNQIVVFAAGVLASFAPAIPKTAVAKRAAQLVFAVATLGLIAQSSIDGGAMTRYALLFGSAAGAMAVGAGQRLINRAVCHLGRISFSLYLMHFALLVPCSAVTIGFARAGALHFGATLALVIIVGAAMSTATFTLIERPGIRFGRSIACRFSERAAVQIAPA